MSWRNRGVPKCPSIRWLKECDWICRLDEINLLLNKKVILGICEEKAHVAMLSNIIHVLHCALHTTSIIWIYRSHRLRAVRSPVSFFANKKVFNLRKGIRCKQTEPFFLSIKNGKCYAIFFYLYNSEKRTASIEGGIKICRIQYCSYLWRMLVPTIPLQWRSSLISRRGIATPVKWMRKHVGRWVRQWNSMLEMTIWREYNNTYLM